MLPPIQWLKPFPVCTQFYIKYFCKCKKDSEFQQCDQYTGTNIRCSTITKEEQKQSPHSCKQHLVEPTAKQTFKV